MSTPPGAGKSTLSHAPRERVSWNCSCVVLCFFRPVSRSTWACELKFTALCVMMISITSRSTWACELKCHLFARLCGPISVTLHVSVWVEIAVLITTRTGSRVTLHVSVWVEISLHSHLAQQFMGHAPRERVSWNCRGALRDSPRLVTLHVSVWVEIHCSVCDDDFHYVTLHVSVWVEMGL